MLWRNLVLDDALTKEIPFKDQSSNDGARFFKIMMQHMNHADDVNNFRVAYFKFFGLFFI